MKPQERMGRRLMLAGCVLMFSLVLVCAVDIFAFANTGRLLVPMIVYGVGIVGGIVLQVIGSGVSRMAGSPMTTKHPAKPIK